MFDLVILGARESGVGAALLAVKNNISVFVSDNGTITENYKYELNNAHVPFEEMGHTIDILEQANEAVKSPGIPDDCDLIRILKNKGVRIISEIEFASRYTDKPIIAITGSNGKTTTTMLIHHLLRDDIKLGLAGNIGDSFARLVSVENVEMWVLELSSFQLDGIQNFKPSIACILNITPDHLDRYGYRLERYADSKTLIGMNQKSEDLLILGEIEKILDDAVKRRNVESRVLRISQERFEGAFYTSVNGERVDLSEYRLLGRHNKMNAAFAIEVAMSLGLQPGLIERRLGSFKSPEHRLEKFEEWEGVSFIDDSKATNVDSTFYALEALKKNVIWIAGGVDKGNDYKDIIPLVKEKVKFLLCLGRDNKKLKESFSMHVPTEEFEDLRKLSRRIIEIANGGDTVLLSPACASFDLFDSYIDRGIKYKEAIRREIGVNDANK